MKKPFDAFISYARADRKFARLLAARLMDAGFRVFYDETQLSAGASFAESLVDAIRSAKATLIVMTPDYFASEWTRSEMEVSIASEAEKAGEKGGRIIPMLVRDCDVPPLLLARVYADCRTEELFDQAFPRIVDSLRALTSPRSVTRAGAVVSGGRAVAVRGDAVGTVNVGASLLPPQSELKSELEDLRKRVEAFAATAAMRPASATLQADPKHCFIAMPFGSAELNDVYEYFVKPSLEAACGLTCERGDDVFGSNVIMEDIRQSIARARIVVADLTGRNPNVFYEVGIAHTLDKKVLLLSQSMEDVPFDLRHRRVLVYENTPKGCKLLEKRVADNINAMLGG